VRPRLLDLFCGAGGAAMGYHRAGFDVVGVDIMPQPNYPFTFIHEDALSFLDELVRDRRSLDESPLSLAAIHASPPCQFATTLEALQDRTYINLIPETRRLLDATGLPYVIENVVGARQWLHDPFRLCGSSFGLNVWRHRLFETNWPSIGMVPPCSHSEYGDPIDVTGTGARRLDDRPDGGGGNSRKPRNLDEAKTAMGIDWMTRRELSQAIPPSYTELIGTQLLAHINARVPA
jgi:DNA (cytosine-5)-methyltransferase 1